MSERRPAAAASAPPAVNPDLNAVHTSLVGLVASLNASIAQATTAAQVVAITDEIAEVNARVGSVGRQLLTQQTAAITRNAQAVAKAVPDVEAAIKEFDDLRSFIGGVTRFLAIVDKAIDVAKLVV
ncbi:hypothetical protein SR41_16970 [Sphingomonas melonis]|uniref:Uncharacterized protein n=1 Tax=Sphingomonas melonis TaxID=152682 RepID=A0A0D1KNL4_9SPHN|nr:hypothetical protein [Sphingomonas melonis]KIU26044.1 hypothetical protein SR41_16970 [Sphingomonas melonis]